MTEAIREQRILDNLELVQYIVNRMSMELPECVEREDLVGTGSMGLIKAVDRFDPARGVKFETYASCLIRGEIMESLRERDTASRSLRRKGRDIARTRNELARQYGRPAQPAEIAGALSMSAAGYERTLCQLENASEVSLEESMENDPQMEGQMLSTPEGFTARLSDPAVTCERQSFLRTVADGVGDLPDRLQAVLALYYGDGLTLREIGELFGITESRVCQLHAQALRRLRAWAKQEWALAA